MLRRMTVVLALAFPSVALAQIHVPGDFDQVQDAIDAAVPGDVIVVHGGTFASITIDKPLTLLGSPAPLFEPTSSGSGYLAPVVLAGPGSGEVVLSNIRTDGVAVGSSHSQTSPGIGGGGFDELHVYDSDIRSPDWCCLTGLAAGQPGISVTVPFVLVERSTVLGSAFGTDGTLGSSGWPGPPGIQVSSGTVVVLDSTVRGGDSPEFWHPSLNCGGVCPNGSGGPGVVADVLYASGSALLGGAAARWRDFMGNPCCSSGSAGEPFVANTAIPLFDQLHADGPPRLGETYVLRLSGVAASRASGPHPEPRAILWMSDGLGPPVNVPGRGALFLSGTPLSLGVFPALGNIELPIPLDTALLGRVAAFQLLGRPLGYSRPMGGVLQLATPRLADAPF